MSVPYDLNFYDGRWKYSIFYSYKDITNEFEFHYSFYTCWSSVMDEPLINFDNIPGGMISGDSEETLKWKTAESCKRPMYEISDGFLAYLNDIEISEGDLQETDLSLLNDSIIDVDVSIQEELDIIEKDSIPSSSMKQMNSVIIRFKDFLKEKNLCDDLLTLPVNILNNYLRYFYSQLRMKSGLFYSPKTLICFRAGIHRFFCLNRPEINIIEQIEFKQSNRMLCTMVAKFKNSGQKKESTYEVIQVEDMMKIRTYFDRSNGEALQREIMFNLIYYFGLRGRETLPKLTKESITSKKSSTGKRYLELNHEILSKNSKASLTEKEYMDAKDARAYEKSDCQAECPVTAWETYLKHIEDIPRLFPKPCKIKSKKASKWYSPLQSVGKNTIDNLMTNLSIDLKLSRRYTNHCIRVTLVTVLKENGYSNAEICSYTGHKNPQSVDRYSRKRRDENFEEMSEALHGGTSSKLVEIQRVSKKSRIVTISSSESVSERLCGSPSQRNTTSVTINFSGSFDNCEFRVVEK